MSISQTIRKKLVKTHLSRALKFTELLIHKYRVCTQPYDHIKDHKTIYCISPYKTGTTFLASGFDEKISNHEPLHYMALKGLSKGFDKLFIRKLNYLNLKLECSGYLSAYVDELNENPITSELQYICILRKPSDWVSSVVNYWKKLNYLKFDYTNNLFWKEIIGVDLIAFSSKSEKEQQEELNKLGEFYIKFTEATFKLKNIDHINIHDLEQYMEHKLATQLNEKVIKSKIYKRKNKDNTKKYQIEDHDARYAKIVEERANVWTNH